MMRATGATVAETHLRMGQPAREVVAVADEIGADLLVAGGGGPNTMRRAVAATTRKAAIGAAAGAIVRSSPCPVLVVRGDGYRPGEPPMRRGIGGTPRRRQRATAEV